MKKIFILATTVATMFFLSSCVQQRIIPKAVNTINSVNLSELNLKHETDYLIGNTATASATIIYSDRGKKIVIREENGEFKLVYKLVSSFFSKQPVWQLKKFDGIGRFGFLSNDYGNISFNEISPESIARNIAIYRLINAAKTRGADGTIEPIISTNVEQRGRGEIVFNTTVSAKLIRLKVDSK